MNYFDPADKTQSVSKRMVKQVPEETVSSLVHQEWLAERKKQDPLNPQPIESAPAVEAPAKLEEQSCYVNTRLAPKDIENGTNGLSENCELISKVGALYADSGQSGSQRISCFVKEVPARSNACQALSHWNCYERTCKCDCHAVSVEAPAPASPTRRMLSRDEYQSCPNCDTRWYANEILPCPRCGPLSLETQPTPTDERDAELSLWRVAVLGYEEPDRLAEYVQHLRDESAAEFERGRLAGREEAAKRVDEESDWHASVQGRTAISRDHHKAREMDFRRVAAAIRSERSLAPQPEKPAKETK